MSSERLARKGGPERMVSSSYRRPSCVGTTPLSMVDAGAQSAWCFAARGARGPAEEAGPVAAAARADATVGRDLEVREQGGDAAPITVGTARQPHRSAYLA